MKVYLVVNCYYDYDAHTGGNVLFGVYSSMEKAVEARDKFAATEYLESFPANTSVDEDGNPIVTKLFNGEPFEDNTYMIHEWYVQ